MNNVYFFMRHGESTANIKNKIVSDPKNGISFFGLTPLGKKQSLDSISNYKGLDKNTIVYASDFKRTKETADIVCEYLGSKKPILRKELRERFLEKYEKGKDNVYFKLWEEDLKGKTLEGVESVFSVAKRFESLVKDLEKKHKNKNILFVTHGDIISIGLSFLNKTPLKKHHINHTLVPNAKILKVK